MSNTSCTYGLWLEPLDKDAVEERDDRLDGLEGRLGRLFKSASSSSTATLVAYFTPFFIKSKKRNEGE